MSVSISKVEHPSELYIVKNGWEWVTVVLIEFKNGGQLLCSGSFGEYCNTWNAIGEGGFKKFLAGIDYGYFMGKCGNRGYRFSGERTVTAIKKSIIEDRRYDWGLSLEGARELWSELEESGAEHATDEHEFYHCIADTGIMEFFNQDVPVLQERDGGSVNFWEKLWRPLCESWCVGEKNV